LSGRRSPSARSSVTRKCHRCARSSASTSQRLLAGDSVRVAHAAPGAFAVNATYAFGARPRELSVRGSSFSRQPPPIRSNSQRLVHLTTTELLHSVRLHALSVAEPRLALGRLPRGDVTLKQGGGDRLLRPCPRSSPRLTARTPGRARLRTHPRAHARARVVERCEGIPHPHERLSQVGPPGCRADRPRSTHIGAGRHNKMDNGPPSRPRDQPERIEAFERPLKSRRLRS
jgi:hypothetical protein